MSAQAQFYPNRHRALTQRFRPPGLPRMIRTMPADVPNTTESTLAAARQFQSAAMFPEAIAACRQILAADPNSVSALNLLAPLLQQTGQLNEAIATLQKSLELDPSQGEIHAELGVYFIHARNPTAAVEACRKAVSLNPNLPAAHNNLGACLRYLNQFDEAVAECRKALELRPDYAQAMTNLGAGLAELGQNSQAIALHLRALALEPSLREAHWNLAISSLRLGDLKRGFQEYEWRLDTPHGINISNFSRPRWDGADLAGRTILLHGEQGMGDIIQFIRYVPLVAAKHAKIIVACHRELCRLLSNMRFVSQAIPFKTTPPPFDVFCPLLSLPAVFGTTQVTIPAYTPYLHAPPEIIKQWADRLGARANTPRIGLVWAGRSEYKDDATRTIRLQQLSPLAAAGEIEFHSLQKGPAAAEAQNPPPGMRLIDHSANLTDFADTAALIANLDVVISIDTAPAHLAGALGKPVCLLLPTPADWRWMLHRTDNPWYPTMTVFRQKLRGQWTDVIERVAQTVATGLRRAPAI